MRRRIAFLLRHRASASYSGAAFNALWSLASIIEHDTVAFRVKRFDEYASAKSARDRGPNRKRTTQRTIGISKLFK